MCDLWGLVSYFFLPSESVKVKGQSYTIIKELGRGGFSVVYLVEHNGTRKQFALKRVVLTGSKTEKERAHREVQIFQDFSKHPNILKMHSHEVVKNPKGEDDLLVLLDYYPKGTLADLTAKMEATSKHIDEGVLLSIFLGVCKAIKQLHRATPPLAHRDLKPHNVLLGNNNFPVLTDFGSVTNARFTKKELKKLKTFLQEEANQTTTEAYCPPELYNFGGILEDVTIDERVDVWSLGCMLYAAAFYKNPFDKAVEYGGSLRMAINNGTITFPNDSPYSKSFHGLIESMIVVEVAERPFVPDLIKTVKKLLANLGGNTTTTSL